MGARVEPRMTRIDAKGGGSERRIRQRRTRRFFQRKFPASCLGFFFARPFEELGFEQLLRGQVELVFLGVDVGVLRKREFHHGVVFLPAEQQADGGILLRQFHMTIVVIYIHLHLPEILVGKLVELKVNDQIAAQEPVVEDEVEEVVVAVEGETLLAGLKEEAFAKLQEEFFQMGDDGGLKIGFGVAGALVEAEEFEDERFFEEVFRLRDDLPLAGEAFDAGLVPAESEALVEAGGFLAFEFADVPA